MEFPGTFGDHILPSQIHNVNLSFIVNSFAKRYGGTAGNVSYSMGLLQTPHTLYSFAGNDFKEYNETFEKIGIDTTDVQIDKDQHTATGFALSDKTNNQIWGYYYGAALKNSTLLLKPILKKRKHTEKDIVYIGPQGAKGSMHFVKECIANKLEYMFDPGFILTQVSNTDLQLGIRHATYIIGNDYEFGLMRDRISSFDTLTKNKVVITTLGEKGAKIVDNGHRLFISPIVVKKVVSTAGAGDGWRAGFLAGLQRNYDLLTCGQMGAVAASFVIQHVGTQEHTFTIQEFQNRYRQAYRSLIEL